MMDANYFKGVLNRNKTRLIRLFNIKLHYNNFIDFLKKKYNSLTLLYNDEKVSSYFTYAVRLAFLILFYGFIVNFVLNTLFGYRFNISTLLALGCLSYAIKVEIPDIISKCFPKRNGMI